MHVSVHFNGWGPYPNPSNYTTAPIHAAFEGSFVNFGRVRGAVGGYQDCGCTIEARVARYLTQTLGQIEPVYRAAGADLYTRPSPEKLAVVTRQLAAGAAELRDQIVRVWRQSHDITVGFPLVRVADIVSGKVRMTSETFGAD